MILGRSRGRRSHLLLVMASVLVPLALFAVVALQDRVTVQTDAQAYVERGADSVGEHAAGVFRTDALIVGLIDQRIQSMTWDQIATSRPFHDYLAELVKQNPELEGAWIADANGKTQISSVLFPAPPPNVAASDYFVEASKTDHLVLGDRVVDSPADAGGHFHIARRRTSADGRFDGIIVLGVSSSYFADVWRHSWHDSPQVLTGLADLNLGVLARIPASPPGTVPPPGRFGEALRGNPQGGSFRTVSVIDRIDRLVAYRQLDPYGVYVFYGIGFDAVLGAWYRHLIVYGGIFGLAALALTAISLIAARHIDGERIAMRELAVETEKRYVVEKQLLKAEKLEAIGQVASGFAHDFGNLLMAVQVNLDFVLGRVTGEAEESLRLAHAEVERGTEAIRSLMIFARQGSLETEIMDAKVRIDQMRPLLQQAIGAHSTLDMSIEDGLWPIEINVNQLELALLNLAVNARDAMPDGGKLRIAACNVALAGAPDGLTGDFVEISVTDTGTGMPPETASKVFEPFYTTKDEGKGTGLGLSQVYGFAKNCGGTATVTSAVGHGTTVAIYIPTSAASITRRAQTDRHE